MAELVQGFNVSHNETVAILRRDRFSSNEVPATWDRYHVIPSGYYYYYYDSTTGRYSEVNNI